MVELKTHDDDRRPIPGRRDRRGDLRGISEINRKKSGRPRGKIYEDSRSRVGVGRLTSVLGLCVDIDSRRRRV